MTFSLALHGGAGQFAASDQTERVAFLEHTLEQGRTALKDGASALDVVMTCVSTLEDCGLYVAGRGTGPNNLGHYELDAAIMDGASRRAGGVCALQGFRSPVKVARRVLDETPHLLLAGTGAAQFAHDTGCETVPTDYYPLREIKAKPEDLDTGTVGAVAMDRQGRLAAATSTGGLMGKMAGRVGDSPLIGAGCWADTRIAVSCTGQGEYFIKAAVAADISARIKYLSENAHDAAIAALNDMKALGGYGGLIVVDANGEVSTPFVSNAMRYAYFELDGKVCIPSDNRV